jgi:N-acetylglutamate synthase-like GNAT family acetyltransferase
MKKVPSLTYFLEMTTNPGYPNRKLPKGFCFEELVKPNPEEYLSIYKSSGFQWKWYDRILMDKSELIRIIHSPATRIFILKHANHVIGFAELDASEKGSVEIVYLGIKEDFIGKGIGKILVDSVLNEAWNLDPDRVWLHTCEYDHPGALKFYQKCGFEVYKEEMLTQIIL